LELPHVARDVYAFDGDSLPDWDPGPPLPTHLGSAPRTSVLEISFCRARLSGAFLEVGLRTAQPLIQGGLSVHDLGNPRVLHEVRRWLASRQIWCVVAELPPGRTADVGSTGATRRWGAALGFLNELLRSCRRFGTRVLIYGSSRSPWWRRRGLETELCKSRCSRVQTALCAFGAPFQRWTTFASNLQSLSSVSSKCTCSKNHFSLCGFAVFHQPGHDGDADDVYIALSKFAHPLPPILCRAVAVLLKDHAPFGAVLADQDALISAAWHRKLAAATGYGLEPPGRPPRCPRRFTAPWRRATQLQFGRAGRARVPSAGARSPTRTDPHPAGGGEA